MQSLNISESCANIKKKEDSEILNTFVLTIINALPLVLFWYYEIKNKIPFIWLLILMKFLLIWHETLILAVFITCCILNHLHQSFYLLMSTYILFKHRVRFQKHHFAKVWFLEMIFLVIWRIRIKSTIISVCFVRNIKRWFKRKRNLQVSYILSLKMSLK